MKHPLPSPRVLILMGVSGSGKTAVGKSLAEKLSAPFFDADAFHPPENIAKMSRSEPLSEADRQPWLEKMRAEVIAPAISLTILACSALRKAYRDFLKNGDPTVQFVYLKGDYATIEHRLEQRRDHFMKKDLLRSQFAALEEPAADQALTISTDQSVEANSEKIRSEFGL